MSSYYQTLFGGRSFQVPLVIVLFAPLALTAAYLAARRTAGAQASSGQLTGTRVVHSVSSWLAFV